MNTSGPHGWRQRVIKKLRFIFSRPRLEQALKDLKDLNDDFRVLSTQTTRSMSQQITEQKNQSRQSYKEVERYRVIGQASRQVYESLSKACTKHTEHQAHFCIEVEQANIDGNHGAQVKFNMAYRHLQLVGTSEQNDLVWFLVDWTNSGCKKEGALNHPAASNFNITTTLKRQLEPTTLTTKQKGKKCVRFQSSEPTAASLPTMVTDSNRPSIEYMRKDFCDIIRRRLQSQPHTSECMGYLDNSANCRNSVYPSSAQQCHIRRKAITLDHLIAKTMKERGFGRIMPHERVRLAKTLAMAVLQYHSTPWLKQSWRSEDVYFFEKSLPSARKT